MWLELGRMAGGGKRFVIGLKKKTKRRTTGLNRQRLAVHALSFHLDSFLRKFSEFFRGLSVNQCIKFLHFPQAKKGMALV